MADGRPLLSLVGLILVLCGGFALFQSASGHFLPHDVEFLGMTAHQLCGVQQCRVVHFMFHDRVAFGGVLIALGVLYLWLAEFPLPGGEAWAWWLFALSGLLGFSTFLTYLGYGYLDTWHGVATLLLLACFALGLARTWRRIPLAGGAISLLKPSRPLWRRPMDWGRLLLLAMTGGMVGAGLTIMAVGMTRVFVAQDLAYLGLRVPEMHAISPRLVPLIAHDRAGFGGTLFACGLTMFFCIWCGRPSRSLWQALCLSGSAGFSTAIGVHLVIGYVDLVHLAPAVAGLALFLAGMALSFRPMVRARLVVG